MGTLKRNHNSHEVNRVVLIAFNNVATEWKLSSSEAAKLSDMSESTWERAKKPDYPEDLTKDQMLRISVLLGIYQALKTYFSGSIADDWIKLPNQGPLFHGRRPLDTLIDDGLPQFIYVRKYLEALQSGA